MKLTALGQLRMSTLCSSVVPSSDMFILLASLVHLYGPLTKYYASVY